MGCDLCFWAQIPAQSCIGCLANLGEILFRNAFHPRGWAQCISSPRLSSAERVFILAGQMCFVNLIGMFADESLKISLDFLYLGSQGKWRSSQLQIYHWTSQSYDCVWLFWDNNRKARQHFFVSFSEVCELKVRSSSVSVSEKAGKVLLSIWRYFFSCMHLVIW